MTIEEMYQNYLSKSALDESKMPEIQKIQTRRAFFAGISSILEFWLNTMSRVDEQKAVDQMDQIHNECVEFWKKQLEQC